MSRQSKVLSFSVPPEISQQLDELTGKGHKTRSEFLREMLGVYQASLDAPIEGPSPSELADLLKTYWDAKSKAQLEVKVVGLTVLANHAGEILIASRKQPDSTVPNLTWAFPGGALTQLDFAADLKDLLQVRTGLTASVKTLISARIIPDTQTSNTQVVALYFYAETIEGRPTPTLPYQKLIWVKPMEVFQYFTSSTSDEITRFLNTL